MQATPIFTRRVRAAMADISVMDSIRGLAMMESPTQTCSKAPEASACSAICRSSSGWVSPSNTPLLDRVRPNRTLLAIMPPGI